MAYYHGAPLCVFLKDIRIMLRPRQEEAMKSHCFIAVKGQHNQGNTYKISRLVVDLLRVSEVWSISIMVGSKAVCMTRSIAKTYILICRVRDTDTD